MNSLAKLPFAALFFLYAAYLAYELYGFHYSPDGEVEQHKMRIASAQKELETAKVKLSERNKFVRTLEAKTAELQLQQMKLSEYQGTLSDTLDVPALIKMLVTEAKKIEIKVDKIEPGRRNPKEFYLEQEFKLDIRGRYHQIALFTHRVAQLQRILRIEAYNIRPVAANTTSKNSKILAAQLSVRAYQYTQSKEDRIKLGGKP